MVKRVFDKMLPLDYHLGSGSNKPGDGRRGKKSESVGITDRLPVCQDHLAYSIIRESCASVFWTVDFRASEEHEDN